MTIPNEPRSSKQKYRLTAKGVVVVQSSKLESSKSGGDRGEIERFEDIEAWQKARELTRQIYDASNDGPFACDFGLRALGERGKDLLQEYFGGEEI